MADASLDWTFGGEWPFPPRYAQTPDGRVHYVHEGPPDGAPVVMLHGNPTWAFLYRRAIGPLAGEGRRVIVPDVLGFGRSGKPPRPEPSSIESHIRRMEELLDCLEVPSPYLIAHDWGAPILLGWAARQALLPERVLLMNTFPPLLPGPVGIHHRNRMLRAPLVGETLFLRLNAMTRAFLFGAGTRRASALSPEVRRAYTQPHPDRASRTATLAFPRQIPSRPSDPAARLSQEIHAWLTGVAGHVPIHLLWGTKDPLFGPSTLKAWRQALPSATFELLTEASHYVMEDEPDAAVRALISFLAVPGPPAPSPSASRSPAP